LNRAGLEISLLTWLHRASLRPPAGDVDIVGTLISFGESTVNHDVRARCMVSRAVQAVDDYLVPLPCDYLETLNLRLAPVPGSNSAPGRELIYQPRREMGDRRAASGAGSYAYVNPATRAIDVTGGPAWYSVTGNMLEVWPYSGPPDPRPVGWQPYYLELEYYQQQSLGPNPGNTTAILTAYPDLYLYAALTHAAPFVRDDARVQTWGTFYQGTVAKVNDEHERSRHQGSRIVQRYRAAV
jgi:hypothetical protein